MLVILFHSPFLFFSYLRFWLSNKTLDSFTLAKLCCNKDFLNVSTMFFGNFGKFHRNMSSPQVTGATKHSSIFHQILTEKDGHTFSFKVNAEEYVVVVVMVGGSCHIMKFNKRFGSQINK